MNLIKINKCVLSQNKLTISDDCTYDEWVILGKQLKHIEGSIQFWIGTWLSFGDKKWGEMYKEAIEITGYTYNTLKKIKYVYENIELLLQSNKLSFAHHAEVASLKPKKQEHFLNKATDENLTVRELKNEIALDKKADFVKPEPPKGKYEIIYLDPPWKYDKDESYFGQDVEKHYPTMDFEELKKLPIYDLTDINCVIYLWTTAPKLNWAMELIKHWGLDYKTCLIWDKVKHNMGFYASIRHEILLIAGRGSSAPTDKSYANQTDSVYVESRTEHSKKPEFYYEMIEKMHPTKTSRIELFARNKRDGWDSWGNQ